MEQFRKVQNYRTDMCRFLFYLGHPAHYHNFKNPVNELINRGHKVLIVARAKDVLFELLESENWDVVRFPERRSNSKSGIVTNILNRELKMFRIAKRFRPDVMIGTDLVITHIGKLLKVPSIVVNEDDSSAVPLMAKYAFPYASSILAPNCCDQSPYNHKKIGYEGYHELAYLHPSVFRADRNRLPAEVAECEHYFILRFAALNAHHDDGRKGIDDNLAEQLIGILSKKGKVFITSERPLRANLEANRIKIHPSDMHHVMAFASGYIGDSQTMAAEAAVLGIPSIRFNDFVGELNYLEELEKKYSLTRGVKTSESNLLIQLVKKWAEPNNIIDELKKQKKLMLDQTDDVCSFWVEVFENQATKSR